jgi:hypothetical protein
VAFVGVEVVSPVPVPADMAEGEGEDKDDRRVEERLQRSCGIKSKSSK